MSLSGRIKELNRYINYFETKYARVLAGQFGPAPSWNRILQYRAAKQEKFRLNRAAKRIQTMFRTAKAKKSSTRLMSHHPNFRRLHEKNQRKIMSLAFRL